MLSAQLSAIGIQAFTAAVTTPATSGTSLGRVVPLSVAVPSASRTIDAAFLCCGESTTGARVVASGTVTPGSGALVLSERVVSAAGTRWVSGSNTWTLALPADGLSITANLVTAAGAVAAQQEFRLVGTITYSNSQIGTKTGSIDVVLGYANFETDSPTATGQMGPARGSGTTIPAPIPPQRCSRPREGCGPLVSGNAACNGYPTCPI